MNLQKGDLNNLDGQFYSEKPTVPDRGVQTYTSMNGVEAIDWCTCFDYNDEEWASHSKCNKNHGYWAMFPFSQEGKLGKHLRSKVRS